MLSPDLEQVPLLVAEVGLVPGCSKWGILLCTVQWPESRVCVCVCVCADETVV